VGSGCRTSWLDVRGLLRRPPLREYNRAAIPTAPDRNVLERRNMLARQVMEALDVSR